MARVVCHGRASRSSRRRVSFHGEEITLALVEAKRLADYTLRLGYAPGCSEHLDQIEQGVGVLVEEVRTPASVTAARDNSSASASCPRAARILARSPCVITWARKSLARAPASRLTAMKRSASPWRPWP